MRQGYSIRQSAKLVGVSASTLARHLAQGRARRGRAANLSAEEVVAVAERLGADTDRIRRRLAAHEWVSEAPLAIRPWAALGHTLGIDQALAAYRATPRPVHPPSSLLDLANTLFLREEDLGDDLAPLPMDAEEFAAYRGAGG